METPDPDDVQGLYIRGYAQLPHAQFLLLGVGDPDAARAYLRERVRHVSTIRTSPKDSALHLAFSHAGLHQLGVPHGALATFAREFNEGMDDKVRAAQLGDDPHAWTWGRHGSAHALLLVYARDAATLARRITEERAAFEPHAFTVVAVKATEPLREDLKEHFGWRDGISTPIKDPKWTPSPIKHGEFIFGYPNEYNDYTESPIAAFADDPANHLPLTRDGVAKDLGKNGTYLIYREIRQHVRMLWDYLAEHSREPGDDRVARAIALGAKMVGRWPGGAPLSNADHDDHQKAVDNDFKFSPDRDGTKCPLGSHIRRANPRDLLKFDHSATESETMVRKHQMVRRGRPFGPRVVENLDPHAILAQPGEPDAVERGLHFICLVAHIGRQFEFVQRAWVESANFAGLFREGDPIVGTRRPAPDPNQNDEFTCQAEPVRRRYHGLPQFTELVGGAYFFLPGINALRFIARSP